MEGRKPGSGQLDLAEELWSLRNTLELSPLSVRELGFQTPPSLS